MSAVLRELVVRNADGVNMGNISEHADGSWTFQAWTGAEWREASAASEAEARLALEANRTAKERARRHCETCGHGSGHAGRMGGCLHRQPTASNPYACCPCEGYHEDCECGDALSHPGAPAPEAHAINKAARERREAGALAARIADPSVPKQIRVQHCYVDAPDPSRKSCRIYTTISEGADGSGKYLGQTSIECSEHPALTGKPYARPFCGDLADRFAPHLCDDDERAETSRQIASVFMLGREYEKRRAGSAA